MPNLLHAARSFSTTEPRNLFGDGTFTSLCRLTRNTPVNVPSGYRVPVGGSVPGIRGRHAQFQAAPLPPEFVAVRVRANLAGWRLLLDKPDDFGFSTRLCCRHGDD
jgi:hypothetical protein